MISPMLATNWRKSALATSKWSYEIKYDGIRAIMTISGSKVEIFSRSGRNITDKYPELVGSVPKGNEYNRIVLDGEIIAVDAFGMQSFQGLQSRMNLESGSKILERVESVPVEYVVFDLPILWVNNSKQLDTQVGPTNSWLERRDSLDKLFKEGIFKFPTVQSVASDDMDVMIQFAEDNNLEGIMAKRHDSLYLPGVRGPAWMKKPFTRRIKAVVGGFTEGTGKRSDKFGGLVLGLYNGPQLYHIGSVGTGFNDTTLGLMSTILNGKTSDVCPFVVKPQIGKPTTWITPDLTVVVEFRNWTDGLHMRMPSYKGVTDEPSDNYLDATKS